MQLTLSSQALPQNRQFRLWLQLRLALQRVMFRHRQFQKLKLRQKSCMLCPRSPTLCLRNILKLRLEPKKAAVSGHMFLPFGPDRFVRLLQLCEMQKPNTKLDNVLFNALSGFRAMRAKHILSKVVTAIAVSTMFLPPTEFLALGKHISFAGLASQTSLSHPRKQLVSESAFELAARRPTQSGSIQDIRVCGTKDACLQTYVSRNVSPTCLLEH